MDTSIAPSQLASLAKRVRSSAKQSDGSFTLPKTVDPTPRTDRWLGLVIILIGPFLGVIDFFIANIGVPTIQHSLGASLNQIELVIAGYGLAYAIFLITGGRLGDLFGRKKIFMLGMAGFTVTSALCGLAADANLLILSRVLQGSTAAIMYPQAISYIHVNFEGSAKRLAFSIYGAMIGFGSIVGQILGGFLIQANLFGLGWRPIFLINLPIGLVTISSAWLILHESKSKERVRVDLVGMLIVGAGLLLLALPFVEEHRGQWSPATWALFLLAFPVLWLFYRFEEREERQGKLPLIQPRLLRDRGFVAGLIVTAIYFAGHTSMLLVMCLYFQLSLGLNPMYAGFSLAPFSLGFLVGSAFSGKLNGALGRNSLHLGTAVLACSLLALNAQAGNFGHHNVLMFEASCFVYGIGRGFVTAPLFNTVLSGVPHRDAGAASGVVSTVQQIANSIGIAVIGAVVFSVIPKLPSQGDYAHAFVISSLINLAMLVVASIVLCFVPRTRDRDHKEAVLVEA